MRWSKIKNIILLLLAVVNLCLLAMVGARSWQARRSDRELREQMVAVLERSGIQYLPQEIPGDMPLTGCRLTQAIPTADQAAALVGAVSGTQTAWAQTTYTGELGTATFSDSGQMDVRFALPEAPEAVFQRLEELGIQVRETGRAGEPGGLLEITCVQLWEGAAVPQARLTLRVNGGYAESLSGRCLLGDSEPLEHRQEAITASTALARFLEGLKQGGYGCSQITGMDWGYALEGTATVTLTPTWYLTTDVWPWRFAVNAYTGAVTAED